MRKFSNMFVIFLIGVTIATLLSTVCIAQQNASDVQVTLKSKNMGVDPDWGGEKATIIITINKMGHLTYIEDYYGTDSDGQPKFYQGSRYETDMSDYTVTFDIHRPSSRRREYWSLIKSKVMLDNVVIYDPWINTSGTYKSFAGRAVWFNNSTIDIGKGRPYIQKKEPFDPTGDITEGQTSDTENVTDNSTDVIVPEKSPTIGIPLVIAILFSVRMFANKKYRR